MKWKQFLKPDWRKIVVFVLVFSLILLLIYLQRFYFDKDNIIFMKISNDVFGSFDCSPCLLIGTCENYECRYYPPNIFTLIGLGIFSYLLSCLIVWIYDKARKK